MSVPTLHYFEAHGRAETIRTLLKGAGVEFEDRQHPREEWTSIKLSGDFEFDQMPMLEIDGHKLVQTRSIERYVAQKNGLYPSDPYHVYLVESLLDLKDDLINQIVKFRMILNDEAGLLNFFQNELPKYLQKIQKRLEANHGGNGFFVGESATVADYSIFQLLHDFLLRASKKDHGEALVTSAAPKLKEFADRFLESNEHLRNYLASRVEREF